MEPLRFSLKRIVKEKNAELDACKLLGAPVFPAGLMDSGKIEEGDYFVAQIRCDAFPARPPFPSKGYLYFFVNIDSLQAKVIYSEEEPAELVDDINDSFDVESCGDPTCLQMVFGEESGSYIFGEVDQDIGLEGYADLDGKLTLLEIDAFSLPQDDQRPLRFGNYGIADGHWIFLIKEEDLKKGRYDRVEFVETEV